MVSGARGQVDFGQEGFIAHFAYDLAIVTRVKDIQRRRWLKDKAAWIIEPHWPSVRQLLHIASELGWEITDKAREAEARVRLDGEALEYSVDVVHGNYGEAWFQCKVGDDDRLLQQVKAIPGAIWDDSWWIPTDWEHCCGPLLEIIQSDIRLEVSDAAWRLLEEPDVSHLFVRSSVPAHAAMGPMLDRHALGSSSESVDNHSSLRALPGQREPGCPVSAGGVAERGDSATATATATATETARIARKARVSTRGTQPAAAPAKRDVS